MCSLLDYKSKDNPNQHRPIVKAGGTSYTFVTDGPDSAELEHARASGRWLSASAAVALALQRAASGCGRTSPGAALDDLGSEVGSGAAPYSAIER